MKRPKIYYQILQNIVDFSKSDPDQFEQTFSQYVYLRSTIFFLFTLLISYQTLERLVFSNFHLVKEAIVSHPNVATILFIACGLMLFLFRMRHKYFYGLMEVAFSLALISVSLSNLQFGGAPEFLSAITAVYVLVRGLDNLVSGFQASIISKN